MIGRGEPRQAERVLLRAHGGLSPLFPGRPQDERERRQHGQQDHEEQAVAQASEREAPHHGSPVSAHVRRSAGDRATNAPNQEPRTPVSRGAAVSARPGACRLHSGRGHRTGSRRPGPVARTIDSVPRDGLLWTSPIGGASMAPSETFPMGQAEPGKPAPESGRGASTAPLPALPAGPRLPPQRRRPRVGKALDSPFPAPPPKDSIAPAKPSPGPRTRRAKLLLDEPDSSISAQPQGRTSITVLSDRQRGLP